MRVGAGLPAGKKVRCPKCAAGFVVPGGEEELEDRHPDDTPAPKTRAAKPDRVEDDLPEEEREERRSPRNGRKRPKKAASKAPLLIGLAVGALVLVGGSAAGLTFYLKTSKRDPGPVASNAPPAAPPSAPAAVPAPEKSAPAAESPGAGQKVYAAHNCGRCHTVGGAGGGGRGGKGRSVDLSHVGANRAPDWISEHIRDPKSHSPESRMPRYEGRIPPEELRALTDYLASLK